MNELMLESLARVAKEKGITESEVLREGVRLQERMLMRKKNIHLLIKAAEMIPGDDAKWSLDP